MTITGTSATSTARMTITGTSAPLPLSSDTLSPFPSLMSLGDGGEEGEGEEGEGGGGELGEGGGEDGGEATMMLRTSSTSSTPSKACVALLEARLVVSEDWTASTVVSGGTSIVAVMRTLAASILMETNVGSTPASWATLVLIWMRLAGSA